MGLEKKNVTSMKLNESDPSSLRAVIINNITSTDHQFSMVGSDGFAFRSHKILNDAKVTITE